MSGTQTNTMHASAGTRAHKQARTHTAREQTHTRRKEGREGGKVNVVMAVEMVVPAAMVRVAMPVVGVAISLSLSLSLSFCN